MKYTSQLIPDVTSEPRIAEPKPSTSTPFDDLVGEPEQEAIDDDAGTARSVRSTNGSAKNDQDLAEELVEDGEHEREDERAAERAHPDAGHDLRRDQHRDGRNQQMNRGDGSSDRLLMFVKRASLARLFLRTTTAAKSAAPGGWPARRSATSRMRADSPIDRQPLVRRWRR